MSKRHTTALGDIPSKSTVSRRRFMITSAFGSLTMCFGEAYANAPGKQVVNLLNATEPLVIPPNFKPSIWFTMEANGMTTVHVLKAEIGQHIGTAFAQIVAEELELEWSKVRLDYPVMNAESQAAYGIQMTGGSYSVTEMYDLLARSSCAARDILLEEGANLLGVEKSDCIVANGSVTDTVSNERITYSDILSSVAINHTITEEDLQEIKLKDRSKFHTIGKAKPALDIPEKVNGTAKFGIDAHTPNMVYGKIVPPPARLGASITAVNDTNAKTIPGYLTTLKLDFPPEARDTIVSTVLVVAETFPAAMRAAKLVEVQWSVDLDQQRSSDELEKESVALLRDGTSGLAFVRTGDVDIAKNEAARQVSATYKTGMVAQAPMEPESCLAEHIDGKWNIYAGSQCGNLDRLVLAGFLQTSPENINFHPHYIGGGFGARFFRQTSILAAIAAKTLSKPTKVIFTREDDMALTSPRSPTVQTLTAFLSAKDEVIGLKHDIATAFNRIPMMETPSIDNKGSIDIYTANGSDHWYDIPNHSVDVHRAAHIENVVKVGPVRGVSNNYTVFAVESMLDEIAHEIQTDPLTLRLSLLNGLGVNAGSSASEKAIHKLPALFGIPDANWKKWEFRPIYHSSTNVGGGKRLANALRVSTGLAGYGTKLLRKHTGQGLAVTAAEERNNSTFCACTAEVSVDVNNGTIDVRKLTVAIDVGLVVNPDGIRAQVEGSLLWGLSNTLQEELTLEKGSFSQGNFDTYRWQTIADVPELDIHILENGLHPSGAGEPATSVVGAAVANAIFDAVGVRIRTLPIRRRDIVEALRAS